MSEDLTLNIPRDFLMAKPVKVRDAVPVESYENCHVQFAGTLCSRRWKWTAAIEACTLTFNCIGRSVRQVRRDKPPLWASSVASTPRALIAKD